ncbi:MAG TPA: glycosyltransferase [Terriglobales bacterium]|nr:glycosyltransferase [Terriglobales bacterium]
MAAGSVMTRLISVIMPLFNAANTLPLALASLQAQTCDNWECVIVDDGSTDNPEQIVDAIGDCRIQRHRLDRNRGRGYARQCALEMASGKYIAFLDADDWLYPDKFHDQVALLQAEPEVAMVSAGMAISNTNDQLVGVRNTKGSEPLVHPPLAHPGMPPLAFAPSMIKADLAKQTGFDTSFPIAEDADFLLRALLGKQFAVLPAPLYVYREQGSTTVNKVSSALDCCCTMFQKQIDRYPLASTIEIAKARGKQMIYHSVATLGLWNYMIARRSRVPTAADYQRYRDAWQTVSRIAAGYGLD